jgi:hypothetical protein
MLLHRSNQRIERDVTMGTNFYLNYVTRGDSGDPKYHVGKRSAAGLYCWDCGVTLCTGGEEGIHYSQHGWHDKCPQCGQERIDEGVFGGAAGRELGFNKETPQRKTGVQSCASFSWGIDRGDVEKKAKRIQRYRMHGIVDEYGQGYTWEEFLQVLEECPVQSTRSIGVWFC